MNSISALTGVPPVGSSTSGSGKGPGGQAGNPARGEIFRALVLEAKGNNTFLLDFSGNRITAETTAPLTAGQRLNLQVVTTNPQVELRIVTDNASIFQGKPVTLLGNSLDIQALFQAIRSTTPSPLHTLSQFTSKTLESFFSYDQGKLFGTESGSLLKQMIDRLGISFEHLLARGETDNAKATLKSALLELASTFKGAGDLAETTNTMLNTLEMYQLAQLNLAKEGLFIFPLPFSFLQKGYLIIDNPTSEEGQKADDESNRFSLNLMLEGLGNLKIEVLQAHDGVYLRFASPDHEKLDFIKEYVDDLLPRILARPLLGTSFVVEQVDPAAELIKHLLQNGQSLVNTEA